MVQCDKCSKDVDMPFRCNYCGGYFCSEHRLPEFHDCLGLDREAVRPNKVYTNRSYDTFTPRRSSVRSRFYFSQKELRHLAVGLAVILILPFSISGFLTSFPNSMKLGIMLIYAAAFLLHEIAHKFAAQRFGYWAEFRINEMGIMFTLLSLFSPLKLVAPGAVVISGMLYGEDYGKISLAGPVTNILQAIILLIAKTWAPNLFIYYLAFYGMKINASLAIFNLLPFGVFDGAKIMRWDIRIWVAAMAASVILYLF